MGFFGGVVVLIHERERERRRLYIYFCFVQSYFYDRLHNALELLIA